MLISMMWTEPIQASLLALRSGGVSICAEVLDCKKNHYPCQLAMSPLGAGQYRFCWPIRKNGPGLSNQAASSKYILLLLLLLGSPCDSHLTGQWPWDSASTMQDLSCTMHGHPRVNALLQGAGYSSGSGKAARGTRTPPSRGAPGQAESKGDATAPAVVYKQTEKRVHELLEASCLLHSQSEPNAGWSHLLQSDFGGQLLGFCRSELFGFWWRQQAFIHWP